MVTRYVVLSMALAVAISASGQIKPAQSNADFELGTGLNFMFNDSAYQFRISGMVQPYLGFEQVQGEAADYFLNPKRSYLNFYGNAAKEKVSFFFQLDFSDLNPLLDAWVAFHPTKNLNITVGQKQTIANNREMLFMEDHLAFADRSLMSTAFSRSGREFGVFIDYTYHWNQVAIVPSIALTSGDGRNSFGANSRDVDYGGNKYAARVDVYPLGLFKPGNMGQVADLLHELSPKLVIGGAASLNRGASDAVGEGHGSFLLYDEDGGRTFPDYRQLYADVLVKYMGFSFLGEFGISTATNVEGAFKSSDGINPLIPTEISQYLALGTGYNLQVGYATLSGYGVDARFFGLSPEFEQNDGSVIRDNTGWSLGLSRYLKGQSAKISLAYTSFNDPSGSSTGLGEVLFQVIF